MTGCEVCYCKITASSENYYIRFSRNCRNSCLTYSCTTDRKILNIVDDQLGSRIVAVPRIIITLGLLVIIRCLTQIVNTLIKFDYCVGTNRGKELINILCLDHTAF